jgi:hypothetical protein
VRARHPERFAPALSLEIYGNDVYGDREVPYPPQRLYCLHIERSGAGAQRSRQVLFLALHRDLHYADWIVHEGAREPFGAQAIQALDDVGCRVPSTR